MIPIKNSSTKNRLPRFEFLANKVIKIHKYQKKWTLLFVILPYLRVRGYVGAGEIAQGLRTLALFPGDLGSIDSTYMVAYNRL